MGGQKDPPYYGTKVPRVQSQEAIRKLLYQYGAQGLQWAEIKEGDVIELQFLWPKDVVDGKRRMMKFRVRPPMLRFRNGEPHPRQTYRFLYWWLKSKLEAVAYGLRSMEEEFLAEVVAHIEGPHGEKVEATIGDIFVPQIETGLLEAGGLSRALGLPSPGPPEEEEEDE